MPNHPSYQRNIVVTRQLQHENGRVTELATQITPPEPRRNASTKSCFFSPESSAATILVLLGFVSFMCSIIGLGQSNMNSLYEQSGIFYFSNIFICLLLFGFGFRSSCENTRPSYRYLLYIYLIIYGQAYFNIYFNFIRKYGELENGPNDICKIINIFLVFANLSAAAWIFKYSGMET